MQSAIHREKARRNRSFMADVRNLATSYKEWFVTSAFYCAIHSVMAHFEDHFPGYNHDAGEPRLYSGRGPNRRRLRHHLHRKELIRRHMGQILREYENLELLSRTARYDELDMDFMTDSDLDEIQDTLDVEFLTL